MSFQSLLSDHEQKAFSQFLGQLAQEERFKYQNDAALSQQVPSHQPRQLQQSSASLANHVNMGSDSVLAQQQQSNDWARQVGSNPLLAPGGIIDPHAMSQAFLQNPELMAQATAISQAMALAQQQQMQQQLQQQQQQHHNEQLMQHDQHSYQQYAQGEQYQHYRQHHNQYHSAHPAHSAPTGDPSALNRPSQANLRNGIGEDFNTSPPPILLSNGAAQHPASAPYSSSPSIHESAHNYVYSGEDTSAGVSKKSARRKGSSATYSSSEFSPSSSPGTKSTHRSSRDDHVTARRKTSEASSFAMNGRDFEDSNDDRNGMGMNYNQGVDHGQTSSKKHRQAYGTDSHHDPHHQDASRTLSPTKNPSSNQAQPRSKKPPHELLTDAEKKANHIASEQKRRQNIRVGFDSLVEIVPTLSECHRSEALILQKSVDYIHRLLNQKDELKNRVRDLQVNLGEPMEEYDSASDMEVELRD
ncbi:hypothetical protein BGZ72_009435 [Mortierella alpina]|nr:hypothetical protein BGZ72_009435 [Mortierella alpina]